MKKSLLAVLAALLPMLAFAQYEGTRYIMHLSGMHLAKSDASAILEASDAANPQKMTITKTSDGYYNIQAPDGTYLSQGGGNNWNTMFVANAASSNKAKFTFETSGSMLKIKNKDTGKYLGVDAVNDPGTWVFIDKDGNSSMHTWFLSDNPTDEVPMATYSMIVNPASERQLFDGWGISLCWWANMVGRGGNWTDAKVDEIVNWLTSPEYLNYNHFRYNIGGGDDPDNQHCDPNHMASGKGVRADMPGFKKYPDSDYDWDADSAQIKILLKIKEMRPDATFEAFVNSAPWWMTNSGCSNGANSAGSDNMNPAYYDQFAEYLVDVCKHFKEAYGIEFETLSPFNEPSTSFWGRNGGQEGCHWSRAAMVNFIKVLHPALQASGLNTVISGPEDWDVNESINDIKHFKSAGILDMLGQVNTHSYKATDKTRNQISGFCADAGIRLVMSEVGVGGSGFEGNLQLAQRIIDDIRYIQPAMWTDWQYMEEGNDQWCMVQCGFNSAVYRRVNSFYVHQHFTKYIKKGYTFLTSTSNRALAARNPEGDSLVVVALNSDALGCKMDIDLSMYAGVGNPLTAIATTSKDQFQDFDYDLADKHIRFTLPGLTIVTFIIPVEADANITAGLQDGEKYLIVPRGNNALCVEGANGAATLTDITLTDAQVWTLSVSGNGTTFTNGNGESLTAASEYAMQLSDNGTAFEITPVGAACYKIETMVDGTKKAFDLEGENFTAGTKLGLWDYGTDATCQHRQFHLLRVATSATNAISAPLAGGASAKAATFAAGEGLLTVTPATDAEGTLTICTLDGAIVYQGTIAGTVQVPLTAGVYAASYATAATRAAQVVAIK